MHVTIGNIAVTADDAGNVRPVTILVTGIQAGNKTLAVDDAGIAGIEIHQVRVTASNPAIDHRDTNVIACVSSVDHPRGLSGVEHKIFLREVDRLPVRSYVGNIGVLFQLRQHAGCDTVYAAIDDIEIAFVLGAQRRPLLTMLAQ